MVEKRRAWYPNRNRVRSMEGGDLVLRKKNHGLREGKRKVLGLRSMMLRLGEVPMGGNLFTAGRGLSLRPGGLSWGKISTFSKSEGGPGRVHRRGRGKLLAWGGKHGVGLAASQLSIVHSTPSVTEEKPISRPRGGARKKSPASGRIVSCSN